MLQTIKNEFKMMFRNVRINRMRYLAYHGFAGACIGVIAFLYSCVLPHDQSSILFYALAILALPIILAYIGVMFWWLIRRINDTNRSYKWLLKYLVFGLLFLFIPAIVVLVAPSNLIVSMADMNAVLKLITAALYILGLLAFCIIGFTSLFVPGTNGTNQYGPPPPANNALIISVFVIYIIVLVVGAVNSAKMNAPHNVEQHQLA